MAGTDDPTFDRALLRRLGDLARLHIAPERQDELLARLRRIEGAFSALRELPAVGSEAAGSPSGASPKGIPANDGPGAVRLRADVAAPPLPVETVLANASRHAAGQFVVPRVVEA
jgi:aspartyl/glutamyl-tRNA(Asn/Gln) amidotransferase C subunit